MAKNTLRLVQDPRDPGGLDGWRYRLESPISIEVVVVDSLAKGSEAVARRHANKAIVLFEKKNALKDGLVLWVSETGVVPSYGDD